MKLKLIGPCTAAKRSLAHLVPNFRYLGLYYLKKEMKTSLVLTAGLLSLCGPNGARKG